MDRTKTHIFYSCILGIFVIPEFCPSWQFWIVSFWIRDAFFCGVLFKASFSVHFCSKF